MNKKVVVASLTLAVVAVLGLGAWLYLDDMRGPSPAAAKPEERRSPGKVDFRDVPSAGTAPGDFAALTPEQQQAVRASLANLITEAASQNRVVAPGQVGAQEYDACMNRMAESLPADSRQRGESICACATRAIQKAFPEGKPTGSVRGGAKVFTRAYRSALAKCIGEDGHGDD